MIQRIIELRKEKRLNQEQFAEKLGLSRSFVNQVETGKRNISDRTVSDICRIFGVKEVWLRTGEGEMFEARPESLLDELTREYDLDELDRKMMLGYLQLNVMERAVIKQYMQSVLDSMVKDSKQVEPPKHVPADPNNEDAAIEEAARKKAETYYEQLLLEARMRTSEESTPAKTG